LAKLLGIIAPPGRFQDLTPHSYNGEGNPYTPAIFSPQTSAESTPVGMSTGALSDADVRPCQAQLSAHAKRARVLVMGVMQRRRGGRGLVRLFSAHAACGTGADWLAGKVYPLSRGMARLVTDVVEVWRGLFKREEARCDGERKDSMCD
jgi:hypothetical protein